MEARTIIENLTERGFALALVAGGIRVTPASALTDADRTVIREHKPELMEILEAQGKIHVELMPAKAFVDELRTEGAIPDLEPASKPVAASVEGAREAVSTPLENFSSESASVVVGPPRCQPSPLGDLMPPEHWEAHGGYERMARLVGPSEALYLAARVALYQRDGESGPWRSEYAQAIARLAAGQPPPRPYVPARASPTAQPRQGSKRGRKQR